MYQYKIKYIKIITSRILSLCEHIKNPHFLINYLGYTCVGEEVLKPVIFKTYTH